MSALVTWTLQLAGLGVLVYFLASHSLHLLFSVVAYVKLARHRRKWTSLELGAVMRSPATPAVSLIVPARNAESTIRDSVRALLDLQFPHFEVIVVNDGSTDRTLNAAVSAFDLMRAPSDEPQPLDTKPIRGVYRSLANRDLVVIDKEHGGQSDAINCGINAARSPLVCVIEAGSLLESDGLIRAVLPFVEDPTTIASGGVVRIANGCRVEGGRVTQVGLPASGLAMFQVVEYFRTFLAARVAQSAFKGLLTMPGAFGIFRRDLAIEAGGFRPGAIGGDAEIVTRLHQICRDRQQPYRIVFQPELVCWTRATEAVGTLARQRRSLQQATLQMLGAHGRLLFNPRYGGLGLVALPCCLLFEAAGPVIEILGYALAVLGAAFGLFDWRFARLLFLVSVVYGTVVSLMAVLLQELSSRRYPRALDLLRLTAYGVLENFGYRQLTAWWRVAGVVDFLAGRQPRRVPTAL